MLVLTRKPQEKIRIGDTIVITVLRTKGKAVSLGIEAPDDVPVVRGELAFHGPPADKEQPNEPRHAAPADAKRIRSQAKEPRADADWPSETSPRAPRELPNRDRATAVSMQRVPRAKVGEVLPRLVNGGPLRAMLDHRPATK